MYGRYRTRVYSLKQTKQKLRTRRQQQQQQRKKNAKTIGFRALRLCLWCFFVCVCIWQVSDCLQLYFTEPISTNTLMENDIDNYSYPVIVACPHQFVMNELREKMKTTKFSVELWTNNSVVNSELYKMCREAINQHCVSGEWPGVPIDTVQGHCYQFTNDNVYRFTGTDSLHSELEFPNLNITSSAQIFFVSSRLVYKYNLHHTELSHNPRTDFYLTMTQFHNINSKRNPCWSEDNVTNCMNLCMDDLLLKSNITCKLPFINSDIRLCSTWEELSTFYGFELNNVYMQRQACKCRRPCKSSIYSAVIKSRPSNSSYKVAEFFIVIPTTVVVESLAYPFSSLTADMLSNVGFFLGISMITICDYILRMLKAITRSCAH